MWCGPSSWWARVRAVGWPVRQAESPAGTAAPPGRSLGALGLFLVGLLGKEQYGLWVAGRSFSLGHLYSFVPLFLIVVPSLWLAPVWRQRLLLGVALVLSLGMFADVVHYRFFHDFSNAYELRYALQVAVVPGGLRPLLRWTDWVLALDAPVWLWLVCRRPAAAPEAGLGRLAGFSVMAIGCYYFADICETPSLDASGLPRSNAELIENRGWVTFHVVDGWWVVSDAWQRAWRRRSVRPEEMAHLCRWFEQRRRTSPPGPPGAPGYGVGKGKNVILIQVESLQQSVLGMRVEGQEVTPNLNRLRTNGCYFDHCFAQIEGGVSSDAEFCALNSLLPAARGAAVFRFPRNQFRALPSVLKDHGYHTRSACAFEDRFWNMAEVHRAFGCERSYFRKDFLPPGSRVADPEFFNLVTDDRLLRRSVQLMRECPRPFFFYLVTFSSHMPWRFVPPERQRLKLGSLAGTRPGSYLSSLHFVDEALGEFFEALKQAGLYDESVIVIYGDHGIMGVPDVEEAVREQGRPYDERVWRRVPLFFVVPGGGLCGPRARLAGQIDIAPTLLHLLGIPAGEACFVGSNLLDPAEPPLVYFSSGDFLTPGEWFHTGAGTPRGGACCAALGSETLNPNRCEATAREVRERVWVSNTLLERDLVPSLRRALATGQAADRRNLFRSAK